MPQQPPVVIARLRRQHPAIVINGSAGAASGIAAIMAVVVAADMQVSIDDDGRVALAVSVPVSPSSSPFVGKSKTNDRSIVSKIANTTGSVTGWWRLSGYVQLRELSCQLSATNANVEAAFALIVAANGAKSAAAGAIDKSETAVLVKM